jgi:hypothetical protein
MTNPSRRAVLRAGVAVAAMSVPLSIARNAMSMVAPATGTVLRRGTFQPHVGRTFRLVGAGGTHAAVLRSVKDVKHAKKADADTCFRLIFEADRTLEQGTYQVVRAGMPALDLFIAPIGAKGGVHEAVVDARQ